MNPFWNDSIVSVLEDLSSTKRNKETNQMFISPEWVIRFQKKYISNYNICIDTYLKHISFFHQGVMTCWLSMICPLHSLSFCCCSIFWELWVFRGIEIIEHVKMGVTVFCESSLNFVLVLKICLEENLDTWHGKHTMI